MTAGVMVARKWTKTGVWAIADRGFFSLSNFLVSLLLARWLPDTSYGVFAMALAVFLLAGGLHEGWITEPLIVFGSARYRDRFRDYLGFLLRRHLLFSLWTTAAILAIAGASAAVGRTEIATALVAAGLAAPLILLQWLGRLACYASVGPRRAALAGGVQLALVLGGFVLLQRAGILTTEAAFGLLGVAGGLTGGALVVSLRPRLGKKADLTHETRDLHRKYGGWAVATGLLTWIPGQVYYLVLPAAGAAAAGGNLRAVMNLVLPLMQAFVALSMVLTAGLARVRYTKAFSRIVGSALVVLGLIALAYGLMLGWLGPRLMHWLYSGRYDHLAGLLGLVGWLPLLGVGATVLAPALRALERPDQVFVAYAASTAVSLGAGLYLTIRFGVAGAAVGLLLTTSVTTAVLGWKLYASLRRGPLDQGEATSAESVPVPSATTSRSPSEKTT